MRRAIFLALVACGSSYAADPFSCVDPIVREAFMPSYPAWSRYSTDVPTDFPTYSVPDSLELIGSQVLNHSATVVYRAVDNVEGALNAIVGSLKQEGWQDIDEIAGLAGRGFQAGPFSQSHRLCRDSGSGLAIVTAREASGFSLVSVLVPSTEGVQTCGDVGAQHQRGMEYMTLAREIPNLKFPAEVSVTSSGSGGGRDEYRTRAVVTTKIDPEGLTSLLNGQLRDQGWSFDGSWSGTRSSGSSWYKDSKDGDLMIGVLHVYGAAGDESSLQFQILSAGKERDASIGSFRLYP